MFGREQKQGGFRGRSQHREEDEVTTLGEVLVFPEQKLWEQIQSEAGKTSKRSFLLGQRHSGAGKRIMSVLYLHCLQTATNSQSFSHFASFKRGNKLLGVEPDGIYIQHRAARY